MMEVVAALLETPQGFLLLIFITPFGLMAWLAVHYYRTRPAAKPAPIISKQADFVTRAEHGASISALRSEHRKLAAELSTAKEDIARIDGRLTKV